MKARGSVLLGASVGVCAIAASLPVLVFGEGRATGGRGLGVAPGRIEQVALAPAPPAPGAALGRAIDRAQAIIENPASSRRDLAAAGLLEQLATRVLERASGAARRATIWHLGARAAATVRTNLAAAAALSTLVAPRRGLPPWRIVAPPAPSVLLGYFVAAQARYRVAWQVLAAIEFIETRFGRVRGPSTAGAQGPMQFLPTTWARYGHGSINDPREAIMAAARYLAANGAPGDMAGALYRYNNSRSYVAAVEDYASRIRADSRSYYGYYYWQVIYARVGGAVILPVGYPARRPVPLDRAAPALTDAAGPPGVGGG